MAAYTKIKGVPPGGLAATKPAGKYGNQVMSKVGSGINIKGSGAGANLGIPDKGFDKFKYNLQSKGTRVPIKGGYLDALK